MSKLSSEIKGKLHEYFRVKIGAFDYRNGWMKSNCPYCGKEIKFGINLQQNRSNCFRCESRPNLIQLVMYLEEVDTYSEVMAILKSGNYEGYHFKEEVVELRERKNLYLPKGFTSILFGSSTLGKSAQTYIKKRGFDLVEAAQMGWGYCTKDKYFGYIILPYMYKGELIYFNARRFIGNGPKYNNPEVDVTGIGKAMILYNQDALDMYRTVYLCEGLFNAATIGEKGIATGGKAVSRYQINQIIKSQVERVVILLDPDAKEQAIKLAMDLVEYKKVKVVFLPDGKDVNDIGKWATLNLVYSTPYQDYNDLLLLKQSL